MNVDRARVYWDLKNDSALAEAVRHARIPLCISDPKLSDNPIVFANSAFFQLTGYSAEEVIGRNCRLLQGQDTTDESIWAVRRVINEKSVGTVEILNYRKDGSAFLNALQIGPIFDDNGKLQFYFGSQLDITERRDAERRARRLAEEELVHRLRNIANVMDVVIRMSAREAEDTDTLATIVSQRLRALGEAHFETINQPDHLQRSFGDLARSTLLAYAPLGEKQFSLKGNDFALPQNLTSCAALCLHELATNSVKHGAMGADTGRIELSWKVRTTRKGRELAFVWRETGGPAVVEPQRRSGSKIVTDLIKAVGGSIALNWEKSGLIVDVRFRL